MPTGLKDDPLSAAPAKGPARLVSSMPRRAINFTIPIIFTADNLPVCLPGLVVPPGLGVTLRASTKLGVNVAVCTVALRPEELFAGGGQVLTPDTVIQFPVDHLAQIWCMGKTGDGLIASVSGVPIG